VKRSFASKKNLRNFDAKLRFALLVWLRFKLTTNWLHIFNTFFFQFLTSDCYPISAFPISFRNAVHVQPLTSLLSVLRCLRSRWKRRWVSCDFHLSFRKVGTFSTFRLAELDKFLFLLIQMFWNMLINLLF
jgi:hypothetical protein